MPTIRENSVLKTKFQKSIHILTSKLTLSNMNLMLSAQALGLVRNQRFSVHNKFYHFIGLRYSEVTEQQICLLDLKA
jgi:hypothetical protein